MKKREACPPEHGRDEHLSTELQAAFGESVRSARARTGLTQLALAEQTGISRVDISRIENGQINVTLRTMSRLAAAFNVPVSQMLNLAEAEKGQGR